MDPARPVESKRLLTLQQAAQKLAVSVDVLLRWNEYNILKPTITPTGEVGYTEEQINQFLTIQKLKSPTQPGQVSAAKSEPNEVISNYPQKDYANFHPKLESPNSPRTRSKYFSIGPGLAVLTLGIALIVILLTQPAKIKLLLDEANNMGAVLASGISKFNLSGSTSSPLPIQLKNTIASQNLNNEGIAVLEDKLTTFNAILGRKPVKAIGANNHNQVSVSSVLGSNLGVNNQTYGESTNFASDANTANNFIFDNSGNIKGEATSANLLASTLGTSGLIQGDNSFKQTVNSNILLAVLALGSLSLLLLFKKQLAYSGKNPNLIANEPNLLDNIEEEKIIEVDQKTDGTVVLCFQGQEYKVSKPELDSESDQFIERLMGLVAPGVKEIYYDTLSDEKISLSAPLSKLVTRLGFVGIKRDLFFPRTSKSRVLFRRYITKDDLTSMNLTADQISSDFLNNN